MTKVEPEIKAYATPANPEQVQPARRMDIEGLRAVAALLVACYHIWTHRVSGAVDVFFFVSAYVMTMSVLRRIKAGRRFSVAGSYKGLLFRMGPHVWLMVAVTTLAGMALMPAVFWPTIREQALASISFVLNYYFGFNSMAYLGAETSSSLFQHLWAMGVQVQFYLVFPLLVWVACRAGARWSGRGKQICLLVVFGLVAIASFVYARHGVLTRQPFAYFDTFARAWEFGLGVLFALIAPHLRLRPAISALGGWIGLVVLVSFGMMLDVSATFPGTMALIPVCSAALIMFAGQQSGNTQGRSRGVSRLLPSRPLVWLGGVSFGIYLWHWPLLVLYKEVSQTKAVGLLPGVLIVAGATLLSWASTRIVGRIRSFSTRPTRKNSVAAMALVAATLVAALVSVQTLSAAAAQSGVAGAKGNPGAKVLVNPALQSQVKGLQPALAELADGQWEFWDWAAECTDTDVGGGPLRVCSKGSSKAPVKVYSLGDSHTSNLSSAFVSAIKKGDVKITSFFHGGCPLSLTGNDKLVDSVDVCKAHIRYQIDKTIADKPDVVLTTGNVSKAGDSRYHYSQGFVDAVNEIQRAGIKVVLVRDLPYYSFSRSECVARNLSETEKCDAPGAEVLDKTSFADSLPAGLDRTRLATMDMTDQFCRDGNCPAVIGGILVNIDNNHVTRDYAESFSDVFRERFMTAYSSISAS